MVKVVVEKETCTACGVCWALVPDVFELDPATGKTKIKDPYKKEDSEKQSVGEVPDSMLDAVKNASASCPSGSLKVE
jgi:ferredoxin